MSMEDLFPNNNEDKDDHIEEILPLINPIFFYNSSYFPKEWGKAQIHR